MTIRSNKMSDVMNGFMGVAQLFGGLMNPSTWENATSLEDSFQNLIKNNQGFGAISNAYGIPIGGVQPGQFMTQSGAAQTTQPGGLSAPAAPLGGLADMFGGMQGGGGGSTMVTPYNTGPVSPAPQSLFKRSSSITSY